MPANANVESCFATLVAPHAGQLGDSSSMRTSSSKCSSQLMQTYSYIGIATGV